MLIGKQSKYIWKVEEYWMNKWFKRLFCKHKYNYSFWEGVNGGMKKVCVKCGKIKWIR